MTIDHVKSKIFLLFIGAAIGVAPLVVSLFSRSNDNHSSDIHATDPDSITPVWHPNITKVILPKEVLLFGERIPLDNWEIKERFEREFYYNYTNEDQIVLWWKRLKRYERMIDSALKVNGLNPDFKYLMVAESGVRNVQSPSKAHGFWQFIPPTAERWGLRVEDDIDERLDPTKATDAAMRYLRSLKSQFGNELLVAAAYNMGESGLALALIFQKQKTYWNLYLGEETMRYPLRIAVIKELMTNGDRYGLSLNRLEPYPEIAVKTLLVDGPVESIADWALQYGFTYKDVKVLNPWLIGRTIPRGRFIIKLPATDKERTTVR